MHYGWFELAIAGTLLGIALWQYISVRRSLRADRQRAAEAASGDGKETDSAGEPRHPER